MKLGASQCPVEFRWITQSRVSTASGRPSCIIAHAARNGSRPSRMSDRDSCSPSRVCSTQFIARGEPGPGWTGRGLAGERVSLGASLDRLEGADTTHRAMQQQARESTFAQFPPSVPTCTSRAMSWHRGTSIQVQLNRLGVARRQHGPDRRPFLTHYAKCSSSCPYGRDHWPVLMERHAQGCTDLKGCAGALHRRARRR